MGNGSENFWEHDGNQWIVSCVPEIASGPVYGFGSTRDEALADLDVAIKQLQDFSDDCKSEWWSRTYR